MRCAGGEARIEVRRVVGRGLRGPSKGREAQEHKTGMSAGARCAVSSSEQVGRWRGRVCDNGGEVSLESVERQNGTESSEEMGAKKERINRA